MSLREREEVQEMLRFAVDPMKKMPAAVTRALDQAGYLAALRVKLRA